MDGSESGIESKERVGLVGFGAVGRGFAALLCNAGLRPVIFDVDPKACAAARRDGMEVQRSAAELASALGTVSVAVRSEHEVLNVCTGKAGLFEGAGPRTKILVHSTISPSFAGRLGRDAGERSIRLAEAPVLGSARTIAAGSSDILVGGDRVLFDETRQYFRHLAKEVLYVGPIGYASIAKLVRNLMSGSERLILVEALMIASKAGMDARTLFDVLERTSSSHIPASARWKEVFKTVDGIWAARSNPRIHLFNKDMPMLADYASELGLELPLLDALTAAVAVASSTATENVDS